MRMIKDLWGFLRERKKYWLIPIAVLLLVLAALIVLTSGTPETPFVYTLF